MRLRISDLVLFIAIFGTVKSSQSPMDPRLEGTDGMPARLAQRQAEPSLPSNYWWPYATTTWGVPSTAAAPSSATGVALPSIFNAPPVVVFATATATSTSSASAAGSSNSSVDSISTASSESTPPPTTLNSTFSSSSTSVDAADMSKPTRDSHQLNAGSSPSYSRFIIPIAASTGAVIFLLIFLWLLCRRRKSIHTSLRRNATHSTFRRSQRRERDAGRGWRYIEEDDEKSNAPQSWWSRVFSLRWEDEEVVIAGPRYNGVHDTGDVEKGLFRSRTSGKRDEPDREYDEQEDMSCWAADASYTHDEEPDLAQPGDQLAPFIPRSRPEPTRQAEHFRAKLSEPTSRPLIQTRSTSTALLELYDDSIYDSIYESGCDEEDQKNRNNDEVPWESLRHKSIKRAILAKVDEEKKWAESLRGIRAANAYAADGAGVCIGRRQTHARNDSDFVLGAVGGDQSQTRTRSTRTTQRDKSGTGFRIEVQSPPPVLPLVSSPAKTLSLASSFPLLSGRESEEADRYTPAPTRMRSGSKSGARSRAGSRASSTTSPLKTTPQKDAEATVNRANAVKGKQYASAALLRSPPTVMTPQIESALCFTPVIPNISMSNSLWRMGTSADSDRVLCLDLDDAPSVVGGAYCGDGRTLKKLPRSQGQGHNRLNDVITPCTSADSDPDRVFTKTFRVRTDRAMRRVEAIVESGWSERGVSEELVRVASPTRFGRDIVA